MASVFAIPPSTTADAATTLCSNVYLDCFPPMDSSASLPNARYTHCHSLTVSRGTDRASAAGLQPTPASKSSTARLLDSRSCFALRSILMENLPFLDVQEMGGSSLSPLWWLGEELHCGVVGGVLVGVVKGLERQQGCSLCVAAALEGVGYQPVGEFGVFG